MTGWLGLGFAAAALLAGALAEHHDRRHNWTAADRMASLWLACCAASALCLGATFVAWRIS